MTTNKEIIKNLQEKIEDIYYKIAPLLPHWEQQVLDIRKGFEKEFGETMHFLITEYAKKNKKDNKIIAPDEKLKKEMAEYEELLKIKYMRMELDFYNSLKDDDKR